MSSSPPTVLGPYQIIREIARSNDIVYEAYDPTMNRRVAIKELAMPQGATPQQREDRLLRFKREAQAAGTLAHANIMTVYSFAEDAGRQYMAMEYLDGHTLRNEIDTKGFLSPDRAVEIATDVLRGLSHAHEKGVIHRDIKPDNVQILSNGQIKITDFGIARLTFQPNLTMDGQVFGTPSYMSPEQVVGRDIDARSDLFSVAVMLYEMISGTKPFAGDSVVSITYAIMNAEPTQPAQATHGVWQVIRQALDKSPALRFSSANEMIQALQHASQSSIVADPIPNYGQQTPYGTPPPIQPQFQVGGYSQTPYGQPQQPYGQPNLNPYMGNAGMPQQGHVVPPPVVYPYNPYQDPNNVGGGMMAMPTGMPTAPVYYPPPPRQPLVTPEMRVFLGRLGVAFVILGTLVWLILALVQWMMGMANQSKLSEQDRPKLHQIAQINPGLPIDERIREAEQIRNSMASPSDKDKAASEIAGMYRTQSDQHLSQGDPVRAEASLQTATELDQHNADSYVKMAQLLANSAAGKATDGERAIAWRESADAWTKAANIAPRPEDQANFRQEAARALYQYADLGVQSGVVQRGDARRALYDARTYVTSGSPLFATIEELLGRLR